MQICDVCHHIDLVFPLKLGPHSAELGLVNMRRSNVVHNVDVYIIEHDAATVARTGSAGASSTLVHNVAKDDTSLCG